MKKIRIAYENGKFPALGGTAALADASEEELRILLCLIEAGGVATEGSAAALARAAGCSLPRARSALRYWTEVGLLTEGEDQSPRGSAEGEAPVAQAAAAEGGGPRDKKKKESAPVGVSAEAPVGKGGTASAEQADKKDEKREEKAPARGNKAPLRRPSGVAEVGAGEVASTVEREELAAFIDICQQTVGRVFNLRELNLLTGLLEELPFSKEYLLTLISYCKKKTDRFSFTYLEKTAYSMLERECLTVDDLNDYLARVERFSSEEWKLRRLLGIGDRRLGSREMTYFLRWTGTYGYRDNVIGIAYDITVNQTGKVSLPYMDKLLTRFFESGCRSEEDVNDLLARERAEHAARPFSGRTGAAKAKRSTEFKTGVSASDPSATRGSSFVGSDYMSAALRRSYGDDGQEDEAREGKDGKKG